MVEPHSSNFRAITTNFWGVRIFRKFTVNIIVVCSGLTLLSTNFQSYQDGVWLRQGAQCWLSDAASLKYHAPDAWHDTTPSHLIVTLVTGSTSPSATQWVGVPFLTTLVCPGPGSNRDLLFLRADTLPTELPAPVYQHLWLKNVEHSEVSSLVLGTRNHKVNTLGCLIKESMPFAKHRQMFN